MQLIIGKKAVLDAFNNNLLLKVIMSNKDKKFLKRIKNKSINIEINNDKNFYDNLCGKINHQFVIGYVKDKKQFFSLDEFIQAKKNSDSSLILIVDSIQDPNNFGSIIRTAVSFKVDALIYKKDNQCQITPAVIKVSQGATSNIPLFKVTNLLNVIDKLKKENYWIYASCLDNNAQDLNKINFAKKTVLIVGNENNGISPLLLKNSDFKINIEISNKIQSLNVACATAILLYKIKNK